MDPVIVMVGRLNEAVNDVEIMPDIPAEQLADSIAAAFKWDGVYDIQVNGKLLEGHQTLAEANAWDGSELIMVASRRPPRERTQNQQAVSFRVLQGSTEAQSTKIQSIEKSGDAISKTPNGEIRNLDSRMRPAVPEPRTYTLLTSPSTKKMQEKSKDSDSQS